MRAIPLFLLVALASLGKTQPTISDKSGLRTILDCMDNPAGEDNVAEKAFVEHWKDVVAGWGSRGTKQLEREVDMRVSMNTCAAIYGDPTIGSINTDPWRNFFKDLINIAATMFCARHTPLGLEVDKKCMADLHSVFQREPHILTREELQALDRKSCQKGDNHLVLAYLNHCAAQTAHNLAKDLYPHDLTTQSQPDQAPAPAQDSSPGEQNGKVHVDRVQMSTNIEQKGTGSFFSRLHSNLRFILNRVGGALPKSSHAGPVPVLPQAPAKPVWIP